MQFTDYNLAYRRAGEIVEVVLQGTEANVVLLDSSNFSSFKAGRSHRFIGGLAKRSPVQLRVPHAGNWHVAVYITPGYRGSVKSGARVLPGALPTIRESTVPSLADIRDAADEFAASTADLDLVPREHDVFICHAGEDKDSVARPLATALRERGLAVWFDEFELGIGKSLRRTIDSGLIGTRFGVVVLSPAFFDKGWPNYELDGLVTREVSGGRQLILPVWHNVGQADVLSYSPSLADKLARSTADRTIEQIADEIAEVTNAKV